MYHRGKRLQSAMEYLMTYGWAILIIAVVLGALFQLGIFNASTFTPKAPPGACHVFRPNGPYTTSFINTQGICNGELPQYVAKSSSSVYAMGIPYKQQLYPSTHVTVSFWINTKIRNSGGWKNLVGNMAAYDICDNTGSYCIRDCCNYIYFSNFNSISGGFAYMPESLINDGAWHFVAGTNNGALLSLYADGKPAGTTGTFVGSLRQGTNQITVGDYGGLSASFANLQIYNTSLSANEIAALYNEGIGGAPIALNSLIGWWPLNGDAKDYSGNNDNGVPNGLTFSSNWESGYSAP